MRGTRGETSMCREIESRLPEDCDLAGVQENAWCQNIGSRRQEVEVAPELLRGIRVLHDEQTSQHHNIAGMTDIPSTSQCRSSDSANGTGTLLLKIRSCRAQSIRGRNRAILPHPKG